MMRGTTILACTLFSTAVMAGNAHDSPAAAAAHDRVSGIVSIDAEHSIALVETPDGKSITLRKGDKFAGGRVVKIAKTWLRVHYPHGDKIFRLTADGSMKVSDVKPPAAHNPVVIHRSESSAALTRTVARDPVVKRLDELIAGGRAGSANLDQLLGPILDLPKQDSIVSIDHQPLGSTQESISMIRQSLESGNVVSLSIRGEQGEKMLYLEPSTAGGDLPGGAAGQ